MKNRSFFAEWKSDLPSGLVVYLVALPLCLGIAAAATGRPDLLFSGVIAGIVGGIVVGSFSDSQLGVSGPAAGLVTIVLTGISTIGSFEAFLLAVVLAGAIQFIAGVLKAGVIGYYFPSSVIKGMLAAIGITLILKQLPHALGYDKDLMGNMDFATQDHHNTFTELYYAIKFSSMGAIVIAIASLLLLVLFDRPFMKKFGLFKFLPGSLIVVIIGIFTNIAFQVWNPSLALSGDHLVQLPVANSIANFVGFFTLPDFSQLTNWKVYQFAFTLALVASLESLLSVEATDKLDPFKRNTSTNKELKAQGLGNMVSGMLGGLPVTQVIVRSSANINAGGKTKLATIIHGIILLLSAIFIPKYLNYIPMASLAAILLLVGYKLTQFSLIKGMYRLGWEQFIPFAVTIIAIISTDLLRGIAVGLCVAIFYIIRKNHNHSYRYEKVAEAGKDSIRLTLSEEVSFLNKGSIWGMLHNLPNGSKVIVDGSRSAYIDYDVVEALHDFKNHSAVLKNVTVELIGIPETEKVGTH